MTRHQYLIELSNGCKAKNLIRKYMMHNLISGYSIGKLKMRKILMEQGYNVEMTRNGMKVFGG